MELEAAMAPPKVRFNRLCRSYACRLLKMPKKHAIRTRVSSSFPPYDTGIELDWNQNDENIEHVELQTEKVKAKWNAPWSENLTDLVDIQIEQCDKSKAKKHHETKVKQLDHSSTLIFYSDGSNCEENSWCRCLLFAGEQEILLETRKTHGSI
ncbi:hypothetical protein ACJ73_09879 [Blastomyces percursus]|uniref:Uncharacterized protein n=1 Tax=Blastomyces percursus TaxID=1658174 RepID=A0A1J9Q1U8_9EURO|nr:hypothetical protein ACJ73_09879 [Blastomyces percursus]